MRVAALFLFSMALACSALGEEAQPLAIEFGSMPAGAPPAGFTQMLTGKGKPGDWVVAEDAAAPDKMRVLAQSSSDPTGERYPLCVHDAFSAGNVDVEIRFRPVAGRVDRAAGIVFRLRDQGNYYVVRANALEDNVRLYHVVNGDRRQFAGVTAKVVTGQWQTLRVRAVDDRFEVFLNGRSLFTATDRTLPDPGRIGLWTKADSVTHFAELRATSLP
jgi:hypothetical protein